MTALSVVICTYNRAPVLAEMLDTLASQQPAPGADWEVVVVDNNCTDDTAAVVERFAGRLPLRRVREPQQGLAHARNRGIASTAGALVLFADDDVLLDPGWLAGYREAARAFPDAGCFGGRILPCWPAGRPGWVRDEGMALLAGVFGHFDLGTGSRVLGPQDGGPLGASFAVRRAVFEQAGTFDPAHGRVGGDLGRGEDTEFFLRAAAAGHGFVYVGGSLCRHRVERERLTLASLYRFGVASGRSHRALRNPAARGSRARAALFLLRGAAQLARGRGDRFRQCVINAGLESGLSG